MKAPIEWLESQLQRAEKEKEATERRFKEAEAAMIAAQKRFEACVEMLAVARKTQEEDIKAAVRQQEGTRGTRPQVSMPDHIASILKDHGRLSTSELFDLLREQGWEKTSANSVNTQLSRHRGKRFDKDSERKWYLIDTA
jgi:hypothetical protein